MKRTRDKITPHMQLLQPINCCIYCGKSDIPLTDEHVIPFSLGGTVVLPKASCKGCAKQTAKLEGYAGRHIFQDVRIEFGLPTRRPKERPTHLPLRESFSPSPETAPIRLVPTKDYPGALILMMHEPAGILLGKSPEAPSTVQPFIRQITDANRVKSLQEQNIAAKLYREIKPDLIMRLIVKIALGVAVAACGIDGFKASVCDLILRRDKSPYYLAGGTTQEMVEFPEPLSKGPIVHRVVAYSRNIGSTPHLLVQLQLFAFLEAPIYTVVIGPITPEGLSRLG
jgi:hypothetical protein